MKTNIKKIFLAICFLATYSIVMPAEAATPTFAAKLMIANASTITLNQNQIYHYRIGFKNIGAATWMADGANMVTVHTLDHVKVEDWFASAAWIDKVTVATITSDAVKPGQIGYFDMVLQAPAVQRTFQNPFALFANGQQLPGTIFVVPIVVTGAVAPANKQVAYATPITTTTATTAAARAVASLKTSPYLTASLMLRSTNGLSLKAGDTAKVTLAYKNTGQRNWRNTTPSAVTLEVDPTSLGGTTITDTSWPSPTVASTLMTPIILPGQLAFFAFTIKAPMTGGDFNPQFQLLMNDDTLVTGSQFRIPLTVSSPLPAPTPTPSIFTVTPNSSSTVICAAAATNTTPNVTTIPVTNVQTPNPNETGTCRPPNVEPSIRVGLATVQGQLGVTSASPFQVLDQNNNVVMNVNANTTIFLAYDLNKQMYSAIGPGPILTSPTPYHVHATSEPSIITLATYSNPTSFDASLNDNVFRGSVSIVWSSIQQKLWIVNELGMENYLRGLAEAGNSSPMEYLKALVVAARTYALYEHDTKSKSATLPFDVYASVQDQAYRGYNDEQRIPNISAAVDATHGQVVTYQGQVVITPYSASTDGHSRSWSEAWGGADKPWLVDKPVPEDVGRSLYGHGVGMSQLAAEDMAIKEGRTYLQILNFFYVNTQTEQWY